MSLATMKNILQNMLDLEKEENELENELSKKPDLESLQEINKRMEEIRTLLSSLVEKLNNELRQERKLI